MPWNSLLSLPRCQMWKLLIRRRRKFTLQIPQQPILVNIAKSRRMNLIKTLQNDKDIFNHRVLCVNQVTGNSGDPVQNFLWKIIGYVSFIIRDYSIEKLFERVRGISSGSRSSVMLIKDIIIRDENISYLTYSFSTGLVHNTTQLQVCVCVLGTSLNIGNIYVISLDSSQTWGVFGVDANFILQPSGPNPGLFWATITVF